ncbi:hypothetical protein [Polaromonas sp. DSR2-3-2]|uniref:hypothetical protein n=1 Tax=unclassified Polaromonas TaxID=2638319 RepID=UPI003CF74C92
MGFDFFEHLMFDFFAARQLVASVAPGEALAAIAGCQNGKIAINKIAIYLCRASAIYRFS